MRFERSGLIILVALYLGFEGFACPERKQDEYFIGNFRRYDVIIARSPDDKNRRIRMVGQSYYFGQNVPMHEIFATSAGDGVFEDIKVEIEAGYAMPPLAHKDSLKIVYDSVLKQTKKR